MDRLKMECLSATRKGIILLLSLFILVGCFEDKPGSASHSSTAQKTPQETVQVYQRSRPFDEGRSVNRYDAEAPAIEIAREAGVPMPSVDQATIEGLYQIEAMGVSVGGGCNKGQMTRGTEVRLTIKNQDLSHKRMARMVAGRSRWNDIVLFAASKHKMDPDLIHGVISQESGYTEKIEGPMTRYGTAKGLMQLLDGTGMENGAKSPHELFIGPINVDAGSQYLKKRLVQFNGNATLAVGSYNAGPGSITRCGNRISPYANGQTLDYVEKVLGYANAYKTNPNPSAVANTTPKSKVGKN